MHDDAATIVLAYIRERAFSPSFDWDTYAFRKRTYERWAAYEIADRILDRPFIPPSDIVYSFMAEMCFYIELSGDDDERAFIFQTATDTAEEIMLLLDR